MRIFHTMEKSSAIFPHNGKKFSTLWKTFPRPFQFFILNFSFFILAAPAARAQLGPYPIQTQQTSFEATIIKRDKDMEAAFEAPFDPSYYVRYLKEKYEALYR